MDFLRWDGYRVRHQGRHQGGGRFISYGHLCRRNANSDRDQHVAIYHVEGVGYQYE